MPHEPAAPPVPISAHVVGLDAAAVMFDQPLLDGPLDASNWRDLHLIAPQTAVQATAVGSQVNLVFPSAPEIGVQYTPPPFDVLGENGVPVQAFVIALT